MVQMAGQARSLHPHALPGGARRADAMAQAHRRGVGIRAKGATSTGPARELQKNFNCANKLPEENYRIFSARNNFDFDLRFVIEVQQKNKTHASEDDAIK